MVPGPGFGLCPGSVLSPGEGRYKAQEGLLAGRGLVSRAGLDPDGADSGDFTWGSSAFYG